MTMNDLTVYRLSNKGWLMQIIMNDLLDYTTAVQYPIMQQKFTMPHLFSMEYYQTLNIFFNSGEPSLTCHVFVAETL